MTQTVKGRAKRAFSNTTQAILHIPLLAYTLPAIWVWQPAAQQVDAANAIRAKVFAAIGRGLSEQTLTDDRPGKLPDLDGKGGK